jgi:hypothetical protein
MQTKLFTAHAESEFAFDPSCLWPRGLRKVRELCRLIWKPSMQMSSTHPGTP